MNEQVGGGDERRAGRIRRRLLAGTVLALLATLAPVGPRPTAPAGAHVDTASGDTGIQFIAFSDSQITWWRNTQDTTCTSDRAVKETDGLTGKPVEYHPSCVDNKAVETNKAVVAAMNKAGTLTWPAAGTEPGVTRVRARRSRRRGPCSTATSPRTATPPSTTCTATSTGRSRATGR